MIQFSRDELVTLLGQAHLDYQSAVDPDKTDFNGNQYVQHMALLSIAQSLMVIADNLTAIRFESRSSDITRLADNVNDVFNAIEAIERRLP